MCPDLKCAQKQSRIYCWRGTEQPNCSQALVSQREHANKNKVNVCCSALLSVPINKFSVFPRLLYLIRSLLFSHLQYCMWPLEKTEPRLKMPVECTFSYGGNGSAKNKSHTSLSCLLGILRHQGERALNTLPLNFNRKQAQDKQVKVKTFQPLDTSSLVLVCLWERRVQFRPEPGVPNDVTISELRRCYYSGSASSHITSIQVELKGTFPQVFSGGLSLMDMFKKKKKTEK